MNSEALRAVPLVLGSIAVAAAIAALALALGLGDRDPVDVDVDVKRIAASAGVDPAPGSADPLAWDPARRERFERRAASGLSHVIYAKSPEGAPASAERTARWRGEIEDAAAREGVDPDVLEAMIFLESAGRPTVFAGTSPDSAAGLGQILPSTATDLLGMRVDLPASLELTDRIARAARRGEEAKLARLVRERARVDQRFDPELAIAGAARYVAIAQERFGREDLAVASYHMGIGNLESVIGAYTGAEVGAGSTREVVGDRGLSYAQLFFDSAPNRHAPSWRLLSGFGDDSSTYLWRVLASRRVMRLSRQQPQELQRLATLATSKATLEEVFHPEGETEVFDDPDAVEDAREDGELVALPVDPELGFKVADQAGGLARRLHRDPSLYRALRPEALAALTYVAAKVKSISGESKPLRVTSAVRDRRYQELLRGVNPEATAEYSLHTTGFSFDVLRRYGSDRQAEAFQFVLDRMRATGFLDYAVEPNAIHVTVSDLAAELGS